MNRMWVSALSASLVWSCSLARSAEPESVLDWIPDNAAFTFFVRNRAELDRKWIKFAEAAGIRHADYKRPRAIIDECFWEHGIGEGTDPEGPCAVIEKKNKHGRSSNLVYAARTMGFDALRAGLRPIPGLDPDVIELGKGSNRWVMLRGDVLYFGDHQHNVGELRKFASLGSKLSPARQRRLLASDFAIYFRPFDCSLGESIAWLLYGHQRDPSRGGQRVAAQDFIGFVLDIDSVDVAVRLEQEVRIEAAAHTTKPAEFLGYLGGGTSDLSGLPDRDPVIAFAEAGGTERASSAIREIAAFSSFYGVPRIEPEEFDRLDTLFRLRTGSRVALHRTAPTDVAKFGRQSLVAILDVDNPDDAPRAAEALARLVFSHSFIKPEVAVRRRIGKMGVDEIDAAEVVPASLREDERKQAAGIWGPDWHRIRFVSIGKQVVVLVGSDQSLLAEAVANVRNRRPGLAASPKLQANLSPNRRFELHFCFAALAGLAKDPAPPVTAYTSVAVEVAPTRLGVAIRVPPSELKGWHDRSR